MVKQGNWIDYFREGPLLLPFFYAYDAFMNLERGNSFPFYIFPGVKKVGDKEDSILTFMDNLVDIHESERNKHDKDRKFYERFHYVGTNIHRLQNDTVANLMFDTRLTKPQYDKLNSAMSTRFWTYMATMTTFHTLSFAYLCYFFRYRKLSVLPWAVVSVFYAFYFGITNKICYKVIVDSKMSSLARSFGHGSLAQPIGTYTPKGLNFQ